jgi:HEPN domain-containing protein
LTPSKNVLFSKDYAKQLLSIAEGDLKSASALIRAKDKGRPENSLYLVQQAVEKAIKSVLISKQIAFPLVHDLGILIAFLPESDYPPGGFDWTALNPFATVRRYEQGAIPITDEEVLTSYQSAKLVLKWAEEHLTLAGCR